MGTTGGQWAIIASIWCVGVVAGVQRGLLSSNVINEHSLHIFARKHLQRTSDFFDVAPGHPRRVHKTGFPVTLNSAGRSFGARGFLRPTVNHFQPVRIGVKSPLASATFIQGGFWRCTIRSGSVSPAFAKLGDAEENTAHGTARRLPVTARGVTGPKTCPQSGHWKSLASMGHLSSRFILIFHILERLYSVPTILGPHQRNDRIEKTGQHSCK